MLASPPAKRSTMARSMAISSRNSYQAVGTIWLFTDRRSMGGKAAWNRSMSAGEQWSATHFTCAAIMPPLIRPVSRTSRRTIELISPLAQAVGRTACSVRQLRRCTRRITRFGCEQSKAGESRDPSRRPQEKRQINARVQRLLDGFDEHAGEGLGWCIAYAVLLGRELVFEDRAAVLQHRHVCRPALAPKPQPLHRSVEVDDYVRGIAHLDRAVILQVIGE